MLANQPKNDTLYIKGFNIVVENRAFTYRQVAQNVGQKACLMPAHYGYLQNNPKVGVFVGAFPENDTVYLINQKTQGGYFDKHIAMFGFLSEQQAVDTYQKCFEYGYIGLMSVIPCTIEQLKWWLANGDKSRPVTKERLPYAGLERLDSVLWGGEDKADLASHSGQVAKLLYQIRQSDNFNHALEPLSYHDLTQELGNQGFVYENYDALVIEYNKLERKAKQMLMAMQGAADVVKPVGVAVSKPLTKGGVANVVAWFEMEDGQAVGVFFHNPDKTPKKIDPTDEMISYKWVLNKKDITIVVAPENGKDLVIRTVAKRIMKLVDANHNLFLKANSDKAELNLKEQNLNAQVAEKQAELDALNKAIEVLEAQKAEREANTINNAVDAYIDERVQKADEVVIGQEEKPLSPVEKAQQAKKDAFLNAEIDSQYGKVTKRQLIDNLINDGWTLTTGWTEDKAKGKALDAELDRLKRTAPWGNTSHPDTIRLNELKKLAKESPHKDYGRFFFKETVYHLESPTGKLKSLSKTELDYVNDALAKKDTVPKATTVSNKKAVFDVLTQYGWTVDTVSGGISKTYTGLAEAGAISDGSRNLHADFDSRERYLAVTDNDAPTGGAIISETEIDLRDYGYNAEAFAKAAKAFNEKVEAYVLKQRELVTLTGKELENPTPTQERPSNWRTNLANARAVAKSLGIETKGKKLNTLLKEIDVFDENEVKKELLAEFKALASRLVLPKGYVFDLSKAEKAIDNVWHSGVSPMIRQKGSDTDLNKIRIELRTIPDSSQDVIFNSVHFYTEDKKTKTELDKLNYPRYDDIGTSKPTTPKTIVEKMEQFLTKEVFPKIEYLKVVNSTNVDASKLSEIGIAEITDIGDENLYFEKDGKYYISKVGNPQLYALGEWDFAKYPDGKPVEPVAQSEPVSEPQMTNPDRDLLDFALVTFSSWKKNGKHRIYLKLSEKDNAFNKMDYGANDLGYLEIIMENGSEKINNLSTVSNHSQLKDKVIGGAFVDALQEYLSKKDIDISDFNISTLKVKIKSDADVLTEKKATADAQANAEAQEKQAKQDKIDLQQAIIKENIAKFGMDAVVNDLSDASLGNKAKVDAVLAGTFLMSDKDFNSFLSFQKSAKPIITNHPDRDYLQSIIEGKADLSNADEIEAKLTDISERLDADLEPLFEQAAEAFAQYGISQAATV